VNLRSVVGTVGNYVRLGEWAEVIVTVRNETDGDAPALITLVVPGGTGVEERFSAEAALPARSMRRIRLSLRVPADAPQRSEEARGKLLPETEMPLLIRTPGGGQVRRTYQPQTYPPNVYPICHAASGRTSEPHDTTSYLARLDGKPLSDARLLGTRASALPDVWQGYRVIRVLLLYSSAANDLRPSQITALLDWVRSGGTLILPGDALLPEALRGPLGPAAGAGAVGLHRVERLDVSRLGPEGPEQIADRELDWPMPFVQFYPATAEVLYEANGLPLMLRSEVGRGRILTLAVPVGALHQRDGTDQAFHQLWNAAGPSASDRLHPPLDTGRFMEAAEGQALAPGETALQAIAGRRGPPPAAPLTVIGILAAAAVVLGLLMRFRRRGEFVWLFLVPAAAALGIGLYAYGRAQVAPEQLTYVGLITPADEGTLRVQQVFAYYSGRDTSTLTFTAGGPRGSIEPLEFGEATAAANEVRSGATMTLPDRTVYTGSGCAFLVDQFVSGSTIDGNVTFDAGGLRGAITNRLPADIGNAVVYAGRRTYRLDDAAGGEAGRLRAGAETCIRVGEEQLLRTVEFPEGPSGPAARLAAARQAQQQPAGAAPGQQEPPRVKGEFTGEAILSTTSRIRNELVGRLVAVPGFQHHVSRAPVLIGYAAHSPVDPLPGREPARQGWSVVVQPLAIEPPSPADRDKPVYIPAGFTRVEFSHRGSPIWNMLAERFEPSKFPGELIVKARPPEGFGGLRDSGAVLMISLRASQHRLTVSGVVGGDVRGGRRDEVARFEPARLTNQKVELAETETYQDEDGAYVLSLKVDPSGLAPGETVAVEDMADWVFESVDVALKGKPK